VAAQVGCVLWLDHSPVGDANCALTGLLTSAPCRECFGLPRVVVGYASLHFHEWRLAPVWSLRIALRSRGGRSLEKVGVFIISLTKRRCVTVAFAQVGMESIREACGRIVSESPTRFVTRHGVTHMCCSEFDDIIESIAERGRCAKLAREAACRLDDRRRVQKPDVVHERRAHGARLNSSARMGWSTSLSTPPTVSANIGHPLIRRKRCSLRDLVACRWVVYSANMPMRLLLERQFYDAGLRLPRTSSRLRRRSPRFRYFEATQASSPCCLRRWQNSSLASS